MGKFLKKQKKGQILLITLLVLTILSIVTVGLIVLANRDIIQVSSTSRYEEAYNTSESQLTPILDKYSQYSVSLNSLPNDFNTCQVNIPSIDYTCTIQGSSFSSVSLSTIINVKEVQDIADFSLSKDRSLDISLAGYTDELTISWDKSAAIDFALIYKDVSTSTTKIIRDVYDLSSPNVISSLAGDDPYNTISGIHPFKFTIADVNNKPLTTKFTINQVTGLPAGAQPISLRITPRMLDQFGAVNLNVTATNKSTFPRQMRVFTASSYVENDKNTPVATIESQVSLYPQADNILDYSLITNGTLTNN